VHTHTCSKVTSLPEDENVQREDPDPQDKPEEERIVVPPDAVACEKTVVIHVDDTRVARAAVVGPCGLGRAAEVAMASVLGRRRWFRFAGVLSYRLQSPHFTARAQ
jgi:hypothetical protein